MPETDVPDLETRSPLAIVKAYMQAWNDHDGAAVRRLFAPNGSYLDPTLSDPLPPEGAEMLVSALHTAFPDYVFDYDRLSVDGDLVFVPWQMRGTFTGPLPGLPGPTGASFNLSAVDVITVGPEGIISAVGYFDQKSYLEQLGLQVVVAPGDA
jgi:steroid delta-isomerase-like uncharacterized protein